MNNDEARRWLDAAWREALEANEVGTDPEIDRLTNSTVVSIRYALVTQVLGKIADPTCSLLTLQLSASGAGAWDARSFSTAVVVPWVADNHAVIGTSAEPYASKPLRRPRLTRDMADVRSKREWNLLVDLLTSLECASIEEVQGMFRRILASLVRKLAEQNITYAIPQRISIAQLENILTEFLAVSSGGLRPLAVAAALFRTLGSGFSLFSDVRSQGINEADAASRMPGDIMCYDGDEICLVVEVKDVDLTVGQVRDSVRKAKESDTGVSDLLFAVPGQRVQERDTIATLVQRNWASGLNIYTVTIYELSRAVFALLKEEWRVRFVREICRELDERQDQIARRAWHELLEDRI